MIFVHKVTASITKHPRAPKVYKRLSSFLSYLLCMYVGVSTLVGRPHVSLA